VKHSIRSNSYELELAKREFFEEENSVPEYKWEDEWEYDSIDADEDYSYSIVDYFDLRWRDF